MKRLLIHICPFVLIAALLLTGCEQLDRSGNSKAATDSTSLPDSEVSGATISLYDGSRVSTRIVAERLVEFEEMDSTMGYDLDIDIYNVAGDVKSHVVADSGVIREEAGMLELYGNVVATADDGRMLETDNLRYNSNTELINTEAFVKITSPSAVIRGYGLETDPSLTSVRILRQVSGESWDTAAKSE